MTKWALGGLVCAVTALLANAAPAAIVAQCGPSLGKSFYLAEKDGGWSDDGISKGQFLFDVDVDGNWDIITKDAFGKNVSAVADGAVIVKVQGQVPFNTFLLISAYPGFGVAETYSVTTEPTGKRVLLWTTNKQNEAPAGKKMAAFLSVCDNAP